MTSALDIRTSALGQRVLGHFSAQLDSAERLLDLVLKQAQAIRARDVDAVLTHLAAIQGEMERRAILERERTALLQHAATLLGTPAHAITLEQLTTLLLDDEAGLARQASAQLRGMLEEIAAQHATNRLLMKQELAFLDHMIRSISGNTPGARTYSAMDFQA